MHQSQVSDSEIMAVDKKEEADSFMQKTGQILTEKEYAEFLEIMKGVVNIAKSGKISGNNVFMQNIMQLRGLVQGHDELVDGLNDCFLPKGYFIIHKPTPDFAKAALDYINKVRVRFHSQQHVVQEFKELLHSFKAGRKSMREVGYKIELLFTDCPDLVEEFRIFYHGALFPGTNPSPSPSLSCPSSQDSSKNQRHSIRGSKEELQENKDVVMTEGEGASRSVKRSEFPNEDLVHEKHVVKKLKTDDHSNSGFIEDYKNFKPVVKSKGKKQSRDFKPSPNESQMSPDFLKGVDKSSKMEFKESGRDVKTSVTVEDHLSEGAKNGSCSLAIIENNRCPEIMESKEDSDLYVFEYVECTPSYRLLPPSNTERKGFASKFLNYECALVTAGSEFKHMKRNPHEKMLFKCEDDQFEIDMLIEWARSTIRCLTEMLEIANDMDSEDNTIEVDKFWKPMHQRTIERIYGNHGLEMIDMIRTHPVRSLPIVLKHVRQKCREWKMSREGMQEVWKNAYADNYSRSLDYKGFHFKKEVEGKLTAEALIQEIREMQEEMEDDNLFFEAVTKHRSIMPHLIYVYPDAMIHKDLRRFVQYYIQKVSPSTKKGGEALRLLRDFMEPMLGSKHNSVCSESNKPLAGHGASTSLDNSSPKDFVFYGNDESYILFRLHQLLYERLFFAKTNDFVGRNNESDIFDLGTSELYSDFLSVLYELIDETITTSNYEDTCSELFGEGSYVLFTMEILISKLVEQLVIVSSDEIAKKGMILQSYERSRSQIEFSDDVYLANVRTLLHRQNIYRFEFIPSNKELTVQLIDRCISDSIESFPQPVHLSNVHGDFLSEEVGEKLLKIHFPVFLKANVKKMVKGDKDEALVKAMKDITIFNGLEHSLTYTSHTHDTEDYLYRRSRRKRVLSMSSPKAVAIEQKRASKFHNVIDLFLIKK